MTTLRQGPPLWLIGAREGSCYREPIDARNGEIGLAYDRGTVQESPFVAE